MGYEPYRPDYIHRGTWNGNCHGDVQKRCTVLHYIWAYIIVTSGIMMNVSLMVNVNNVGDLLVGAFCDRVGTRDNVSIGRQSCQE